MSETLLMAILILSLNEVIKISLVSLEYTIQLDLNATVVVLMKATFHIAMHS